MKDKENYVKELFTEIASRYDFLNHFLSFGIDKFWRKKTAKELNLKGGILLDVCSGTGDMALVFDNSIKKILCDFCHPLLKIADKKLRKKKNNYFILEANALNLPIKDNSIDVITIAFGLRNLSNTDKALTEFYRVLKKNGKVAILEFTLPRNKCILFIYKFYLKHIVPLLGAIISGSYKAYNYLQQSIQEFPKYEELITIMNKNNFNENYYKSFTFGIATLYIGKK